MSKGNTNKDSVSGDKYPDLVIDRFGFTKTQDDLYTVHRSGAKIKLNIDMYDTFTCRICGVEHVFLLPKGATPCHLHSDKICCKCCMRNGTSNYCIGKNTSYVMER